MYIRQYFLFLGLLVLVSCSGCGEPQIKASGTVKFEDGSPLTCGIVVLSNSQFQYTGKIESDGSFQLGGLVEKGGLPAGSYTASIQNAMEDDKLVIPVRYTSDVSSGLSFEITKESAKNPLVITLSKK